MQVREFTRRPLVSVTPDTPVREVARLMDRTVVGAVVVVEGHRPVGIVTDREPGGPLDGSGPAGRWPDRQRDDGGPGGAGCGRTPHAAVALFEHHGVRRLPLVEEDRVIGLLAVDDLLVNTIADLTAAVRPITGQVLFGHPESGAALVES